MKGKFAIDISPMQKIQRSAFPTLKGTTLNERL